MLMTPVVLLSGAALRPVELRMKRTFGQDAAMKQWGCLSNMYR
jgi:hypothetical protein